MESSHVKKWAELTAEEEVAKLLAIGALLQEYGIEKEITPLSADHQANMLKSSFTTKQSKLVITGKVPADKAVAAKEFTKRVKKEVLGGINQYTYLLRIDVQPLSVGEPLPALEGMMGLFDKDLTGITAKQGQVQVISLWASWCAGSLRTTEELNALSTSAKGNDAAVFYSVNFDEAAGAAQKICDQNNWLSLKHLHVGTSAADLTLGGRMIPRIILINKEGKVAFIGHPSKLDIQRAVATLVKGDALELPAESLNEDDFSADVSIVPGVTGTYSSDISLAKVREEMAAFTQLVGQFAQDNKAAVRQLETDHIIIHRQTKLVEGKELLTRYQQITMLASNEPTLNEVRAKLEALYGGFTFQKEIEATVI